MAATYGQGEFAINLAPLIVGNTVTVSGDDPGTGTGSPPVVTGPITISGTSEITGFGNATWITVEDVTNPADPMVIAGFNPADRGPDSRARATPPTPWATSRSRSTRRPTTRPTATKTIEVFATDNAGSVGNMVTYSFNLNPPTQLMFATHGRAARDGARGPNFAAPRPVIVDVEDAAGNIATTFNGPVTIALANNATGTFARHR